MRRSAALLLGVLGCASGDPPAPCTCAPTAAAPATLLRLLRRHQAAVRDGQRNGRDTKLVDDEIRIQSSLACQPCGDWVGERATPEDLYPLARLDAATGVVCGGLVLAAGVAWGDARPSACRR